MESFEEEALSIKEKLPENISEFKVFSSPLQRCRLLSEYLFPNAFTIDERLKELNFGQWEMRKWEAINSSELTWWMDDFVNRKPPGGESYMDLFARVTTFFEESLQNPPPGMIVVSHAGAIRATVSYFNKTDLRKSFDYRFDYGEIIKLENLG